MSAIAYACLAATLINPHLRYVWAGVERLGPMFHFG